MLDEFRSSHITWDKATSRIYSTITANESDENGRKLVVQIINGGQVEDLTGASLHLYWETRDKAHDGLDVFKAVDLKNGEFELSYTTGMLSNKGALNANLVLIDTVGRVVSERFKITVTEGIDNDAIQSENSFSSLTQALIDISNLEQNYAPRLNDLTAQLQQTEQELSSQLAQNEEKRFKSALVNHKQRRPMLTLIDDDGRIEVMEKLKPLADEYDIPMTLAVITDRTNGNSEYLSLAQLKELEKSGFEIVSHAASHTRFAPPNDDPEFIREEMERSSKWLKDNGFEDKILVYPFGASGRVVRDEARKVYECGIDIDRTSFDSGVSLSNKAPISNYRLNRIAESRGLDYAKNAIDEVKENNGWGIYLMHCATSDWTESQTRAVIEYALSVGVEIVKARKGLNTFGNLAEIGDLDDVNHGVVDSDGNLHGTLTTGLGIIRGNVDPNSHVENFVTGESSTHYTTAKSAEFGLPSGGTLKVTKSDNPDYSFQEFIMYKKNTRYYRFWDTTTEKWSEWSEEHFFEVDPDSPITDYKLGESMNHFTANQATGFGLPGAGVLKTVRAKSDNFSFQVYSLFQSPDESYRYWNGSSWSKWVNTKKFFVGNPNRNIEDLPDGDSTQHYTGNDATTYNLPSAGTIKTTKPDSSAYSFQRLYVYKSIDTYHRYWDTLTNSWSTWVKVNS